MSEAIAWSAVITFGLAGLLLAARACARVGFAAGFDSGWDAGRQALRDEAERAMLERRRQEQARRAAVAMQVRPEDRAN